MLVAGLTILFAGVAAVLIFLVEFLLLFVSAESEARLFQSWVPGDIVVVESADSRLDDASALLSRLVEHMDETPYQFRLQIDDSDEPNAMAFPGGLIVVTRGLLDGIGSENELAFVLGHELGHFNNRDHMRSLGRGFVLAVAFQMALGGDGGFGLSIADLASRRFSRSQESAADVIGLSLVYREYGHVADATRFFERLEAEGIGDSKIASYASTHPAAASRIADLQSLARDNGWSLNGSRTDFKP